MVIYLRFIKENSNIYATIKNIMISFASQGVFLVTTKNAFVPVKCVHSVNTYSRISTVP